MINSSWAVIATYKYTWYISSILIFQYLNISSEQLAILWALMVADFILWVWKQIRIDTKELSSHNAWLWLMKKLTTLIIIFSVSLGMKWNGILDESSAIFMRWMISLLVTFEIYSIIQNWYTIRTWKIVKEYDAISIMLKSFWLFIRNLIDKRLWSMEAIKINDNENDSR